MKTFFLFGAFWLSSIVYSQIGINTPTPEATLDIRAKNHNGTVTATDGVLVPRVNSLSVNGSINGQLVYLTVDAGAFTQGFYYWNGSAWTGFSGTGSFVGDISSDVWVDNSGSTAVVSAKPVVIGSATSAHSSAMLDLSSVTTKGVSIPNVTLSSINDVTTVISPKNGLIVFNTTAAGSGTTAVSANTLYVWNSNLSVWDKVVSANNNISNSSGSAVYKTKHRGRNLDTAGFPKPTLIVPEMNLEVRWAVISGVNYFQFRLLQAPATNVDIYYMDHWHGQSHNSTSGAFKSFTPANYSVWQSVDGDWSGQWGYYLVMASNENRSTGYNPLNYMANMYGLCGFGNGWRASAEPYSLAIEVF